MSMMYDAVFRGRNKSWGKVKAEVDLVVRYETVSTVESHTIRATTQHMAKNAKNVGKTITLRQCVKVINVIPVLVDIRKAKVKGSMRLMNKKMRLWII